MKEFDNIENKLDFQPENGLEDLADGTSSKDYNYLYFQEMLNVRIYRKEIQKKMEELNEKRKQIYQKVVYYEKKTEEQFKDYIRGEVPERKKRNRRNADEIDRQFNCPTCGKKYGSEGSMHQHIKLKHPSSYEARKKSSKNEESIESQQFEES